MANPPETIGEAIEQVAKAPKRTKTATTEFEEFDLDQLIKADNHIAGKAAAGRSHMGLRFVQCAPPGAG